MHGAQVSMENIVEESTDNRYDWPYDSECRPNVVKQLIITQKKNPILLRVQNI